MSFIIVLILIILSGLLVDDNSYFSDLRVEAGGFLFDIILFGLILGYYNYIKSKKRKSTEL